MTKLKYIFYTLYAAALLYLVLLGGGNDTRQDMRLFQFDKGVNFIPFTQKIAFITYEGEWYDNDWFYFYREITGNLLLLFPVPFFLIGFEKYNSWRRVLLFCLGLTFSIEFLQFLLNIGQADIDDILLNLAGAALATAIAFGLKRLANQRRQYDW